MRGQDEARRGDVSAGGHMQETERSDTDRLICGGELAGMVTLGRNGREAAGRAPVRGGTAVCTRDLQPLLLRLRQNVQEKAQVGKTTWTCMGTRASGVPAGGTALSFPCHLSTQALRCKTREHKGAYGSSEIPSMHGQNQHQPGTRQWGEGTGHPGSLLQS